MTGHLPSPVQGERVMTVWHSLCVDDSAVWFDTRHGQGLSKQPPADAIDKAGFVEVQQQPRAQAAELQVGVKLGLMHRMQHVDRFDLQQQSVLDNDGRRSQSRRWPL